MVNVAVPDNSGNPVFSVLRELRSTLDLVHFPIHLSHSALAAEVQSDLCQQLDDYVLPRFESLDAPLLAVVGGSTGAGKSTFVNSLVGENLTHASALRPTTRIPTLICHPQDRTWFETDRILPSLARVTGSDADGATQHDFVQTHSETAGTEIALKTSPQIPRGLAIIDSPDIDSLVKENRVLAAQLMAAADLWIFVTTAHRYADAIPWAMLDDAAQRDLVIGVLLNRVPIGVGIEVRADLVRKLKEHDLEHAPLFVVSETDLGANARLPEADVDAIRGWIWGIARDSSSRSLVAKQTLMGVVKAMIGKLEHIESSYAEQVKYRTQYDAELTKAFNDAHSAIAARLSDGSLLKGEVLRSWQDLIGTSQWARKLESQVSLVRDRLTSIFTARKPHVNTVEEAVGEMTFAMVVAQSQLVVTNTLRLWQSREELAQIVPQVRSQLRTEAKREQAAQELVHDWHRSLIDMIRTHGDSKKAMARIAAFGINAVGVALIIVVFASTGGLVGGEIAIAGGTAIVAQRVLEAIFGDDAVRRMAREARVDFEQRLEQFLATDREVFERNLESLQINEELLRQLKCRSADLRAALADGR
ncbi:dynamin family protein [Arcanobacterium bovis]|uniref:Dynamin N-terminal domain-containing protein n=1 Tax=Arcanobacterium bovis TaxID=2529275 RepID=A0A4Q9V1B0_9ACTO|nr:dynamin family protein [Arcanobacterium bovis]TBW22890.1 hypothetical protein EZJ44_03055 [Arcanobacterium bovis]